MDVLVVVDSLSAKEANKASLSILVLHGPNLNLLGLREPEIYGSLSLDDINRLLVEEGRSLSADIFAVQSNHEGALVDAVHDAFLKHQGIIINAGAY
ncbi:MAG: type II 3-dehydroquinate dehydratase, partial [Cyanobacteria bacterium J06573_2]